VPIHDGREGHDEADTAPIDTSQHRPVLSFTTLTDSPVSCATQCAAASAFVPLL
jgi:hypothetical protein